MGGRQGGQQGDRFWARALHVRRWGLNFVSQRKRGQWRLILREREEVEVAAVLRRRRVIFGERGRLWAVLCGLARGQGRESLDDGGADYRCGCTCEQRQSFLDLGGFASRFWVHRCSTKHMQVIWGPSQGFMLVESST